MKRKSLYIQIGIYLLVCLVVFMIVGFVFWSHENSSYKEGIDNSLNNDAIADASANLQVYRDYGRNLDPQININPGWKKNWQNNINTRNTQSNYYNYTSNEKNLYCYNRNPEYILDNYFFKSKDFSLCNKTQVSKDPYPKTIITDNTDFNVPNVRIPRGVVSFKYTVIGGGGAGGGGGGRFTNVGGEGGGGGGGGSSGGIITGEVSSMEGINSIRVALGKGGEGPVTGNRYTHRKFYKRPKRSWEEKYYNFGDGDNPVSKQARDGTSTTLTFGNKTIVAPGGKGGFVGGNMGMTRDNADIVRGGGRNLYPENPGFGSNGGWAVPNGIPGQRGFDGNSNLGGNKSKGGMGGQTGFKNRNQGIGDGGNGGNGGIGNDGNGQYGASGRGGAVIIEWK